MSIAALPRPADELPAIYQQFLADLRASGFVGEIQDDYATRTLFATDNSLYQLAPQAAVFPKDAEDAAACGHAAGPACLPGGGAGTGAVAAPAPTASRSPMGW